MQIQALPQDFAGWISVVLRLEVKEVNDGFVFSASKGQSWHWQCDELNNLIQQLTAKEEESTAIYDERSYEVIIRHTASYAFLGTTPFKQKDDLNGITYTLSYPSDEYLLFLLYRISQTANVEYLSSPVPLAPQQLNNTPNVLELLRKSSSRFLTLRVTSKSNKPVSELSKYATAFLFDLGYNLDAAFIAPKHFDDLLRYARLRKQGRKTMPQEVLPPKRFYSQDLTYYYQLALATEVPSLEYLSYYHIIEHFGETIFMADMVERVKQVITQPDFSYRRDGDIKKLINTVEKLPKTTPRNDAGRDERAVKMTLEKYVEIPGLLDKLTSYDSDLVRYYKSKSVSFVDKGPIVDLEDNDYSQVFAHLAHRIYSTRNAIVHSKDSEQSRYVPFKHDESLIKEIPLLRSIAELIIIATSTVIS